MSFLSAASYGKDNVRVLKVKRDPSDPSKQDVIEMTVRVLLQGEIDVSYTHADNSPVVPTDTVKIQSTFWQSKPKSGLLSFWCDFG